MNTEEIAMNIIAHSGEALAKAFEALEEAKKGNFDQANILMKESQSESNKAHKSQTELLFAEANGENPTINILLIHSQDHMMTSMMTQQLIKEIIYLHEHKENR